MKNNFLNIYNNLIKLTRNKSLFEKLNIQEVDFQLQIGDVVFLCSDGLYNEFGEEYIKKKCKME